METSPVPAEEESLSLPFEADAPACPNCGSSLYGQFCARCGQNQRHPDRSFILILSEFFEDILSRDSRPARTLLFLLFRPGFLTAEYFAGRRARYVHPFRLYIVTSLAFFFYLSVQSLFWSEDSVVVNGDDDVVVIGDSAEGTADTSTVIRDITADLEDATTDEDAAAIAEEIVGEIEQDIEKAKAIADATEADSDSTDDDDISFDEVHFEFLSDEDNDALRQRLETQANKAREAITENPSEFFAEMIELFPQIMFLLLPVFAFAMKFFYIGQGVYYTEHLVLAVHNQSFVFLAVLLMDGLEALAEVGAEIVLEPLSTVLGLWIVVYIYLSAKVYFGQSHFVTMVKTFMLATVYGLLFIIGLIFAFVWGVMTL